MTDTVPTQTIIESNGKSNDFKQKHKTKLKFLKYSPPSSAGAEPGPWRQVIGQRHLATAPGGGHRTSPDDSDLDVISLSMDVANVSLDFKDASSGKVRINVNENKRKGKSGKKWKNCYTSQDGLVSGRSMATPSTPGDPLVFNGKWTRRSTSNRLLNCFTIDDCMARYRNRLALGHGGPEAWATGKAELAYTLDTFPNPKNSMDDKSEAEGRKTRKSHVSGRYSRGSSACETQRETSFEDTLLPDDDCSDICNNDNVAVAKAMQTILSSNEVVNNIARTGLFRKPKRPRKKEKKERPTSTRFQKMNDTLHKWIDDEIILPRSRLGSMNSLRSRSLDEGSTSLQNDINRSTPRSTSYRGPRSMDAPPDILQRKHDYSKYSKKRPHSADNGNTNHNGPHRSDSFLEMLMELDEDKRATQGEIQVAGGEDETIESERT